jgi:Lysyl oxidase
VVAAVAAFVGSAGAVYADPPTQVLPDMRQSLPGDVKVSQVDGTWLLGFSSKVANDGPGYLKITGNGIGDGTMTADQIVQMTDGSSTTVSGIGQMAYVYSAGHQHWHLLDFERYELRDPDNPGDTIVRDQKTGFCLANAFTNDICGRNHPEFTTVSEVLAVGGTDTYLAYLEGQSIPLDPATTPTGDYLLVNRVNPTGALLEADPSDNASSVRLHLEWSSGQPAITITNSCPGTIACAAPPPQPDPDPGPGPQQPPADQQPPASDPQPAPTGSDSPPPEPQKVPIVPPSQFGPKRVVVSMSREMAGRLVRRAIRKSTKHTPRRLRTTCGRQSRSQFACNSTWRSTTGARWSGHVRVWFVERGGNLEWFYDLAAHPAGGKPVVKRSVRGSASSTGFFQGAGAVFYCARLT